MKNLFGKPSIQFGTNVVSVTGSSEQSELNAGLVYSDKLDKWIHKSTKKLFG